MQQDQLSAMSSAGEAASSSNLHQQHKVPQQILSGSLNMGTDFVAASGSNPSTLNLFPAPPPPPPPRTSQRAHSPSMEGLTRDNLLCISNATAQRQSMIPLNPPPPPPPPRPARISGGSSNLMSQSPTSSCSSLSSLVMTGCKTGPFLKGELAILKKEQAMAEALAAAQAINGSAVMTRDRSRSPSEGLETLRSACAYAASGRIEELNIHPNTTGDMAYCSLQPPPPPPKPQWQISSPLPAQPLRVGDKIARIEKFLAMIPDRTDDEPQQLRPPSYSDWVGNNQQCGHHSSSELQSSDMPKSILQSQAVFAHSIFYDLQSSDQEAPREKSISISGIAEQDGISSRASTRDLDVLPTGSYGEASETSQDHPSSFEHTTTSWMMALDGGSSRTSASGGEFQRRSMEYYLSRG